MIRLKGKPGLTNPVFKTLHWLPNSFSPHKALHHMASVTSGDHLTLVSPSPCSNLAVWLPCSSLNADKLQALGICTCLFLYLKPSLPNNHMAYNFSSSGGYLNVTLSMRPFWTLSYLTLSLPHPLSCFIAFIFFTSNIFCYIFCYSPWKISFTEQGFPLLPPFFFSEVSLEVRAVFGI